MKSLSRPHYLRNVGERLVKLGFGLTDKVVLLRDILVHRAAACLERLNSLPPELLRRHVSLKDVRLILGCTEAGDDPERPLSAELELNGVLTDSQLLLNVTTLT